MTRRIALTVLERESVTAGDWIRVELGGASVVVGDGAARSALVGAIEGRVCAYANVCRHQDVPLDVGLEEWPEASGELVPAPLTDDGRHLICLRHGALYRLDDGECIEGPCEGEALQALRVVADGEDGTELALELE